MDQDSPAGGSPALSPLAAPAVVKAAHLERDPLKYDFKNFLWKTWNTLGYKPTPLHYDMADWMQFGPRKSITMAFRGATKSYIAVTRGLHCLYCDPEEIVLTVSGTSRFAALNASFAWSMLNGFDWLAHMKPSPKQKQSSIAFDVAGARPKKSESFCSESLFGQITGRRATFIIPDDVETPSTSSTETERTELAARYAELGSAILLPGGRVNVLGTAQTENTLYLDLAMNKGYGMRMWPIYYPTPEEIGKYGAWLAPSLSEALKDNPSLAGTSTEPSRFDEADIFERRLEWGRTEFDRQFRLHLDAGVTDQKPLKLRDLIVMSIPTPTKDAPLTLPAEMHWQPSIERRIEGLEVDSLNGDGHVYSPFLPVDRDNPWGPPEGIILQIDPSGTGTDETAWVILAQYLGRVFLCHASSRLEGFTAGTLEAIAKDAKAWGVNVIRIEKNFGGGMFAELLRPVLLGIGHPCSIEEENAKGQKEVRIVDSLETLVTSHRLVVSEEVLRNDYSVTYDRIEDARRRFYRLTYQFTRITKQKGCLAHDDRLDALASGTQHFIGVLRRQLESAASENKAEYIKAQLQLLIESRRRLGLQVLGDPEPTTGVARLGKLLKDYGMQQSSAFPGRRR